MFRCTNKINIYDNNSFDYYEGNFSNLYCGNIQSRDSNLNINHNRNNNSQTICPICYKNFSIINLETHMMNCEELNEENNFHINNENMDSNSDNLEIDESFESQNNHGRGNGEINFSNHDLGYEDLLSLDDNLKNPLSKKFLWLLIDEKMTAELFSKLDDENGQCLICFEKYQIRETIIRLPCTHFFHSNEIRQWFESNKTCPVCRLDVNDFYKNNK